MIRGKTISLYLIDGEANGRIMCELSNWTGKAYKIPRKHIKDSDDRGDLKRSGVYLLFGSDSDSRYIYVGESENVYKRLCQHNEDAKKDFWNDAIVFISKDNKLNKAHIKYLEHRLYNIAKEVDRYEIINSSIPTKSNVCESDEADMEEFIEKLKLLVDTLGYKTFEPIRKDKTPQEKKVSLFYIKAKGVKAEGEQTNEGFVVYKNSEVIKNTQPSLPNSGKINREKLINNGSIIEKGDNLLVVKDIVFSSPSAAAVLILGRSANGLTEWKLADGTSLKSINESCK